MLEEKVAQNISKVDPKSRQCRFYIRVRFFTIAQKVAYHLGFFGKKYVSKNFQKSGYTVYVS